MVMIGPVIELHDGLSNLASVDDEHSTNQTISSAENADED